MLSPERINSAHLERDIIAHLIANKLKLVDPNFKAVPNHIIAGPSGSGKTTSLQDICDKYDVPLIVVQGSELVSQMEGQGTAALEEAILEASQRTESWIAAILIDDTDMGGCGRIGSVDNKATQGFVMSWLDNPNKVTIERPGQHARTMKLTNPAVSFMTTNNLDAIHPPIAAPHRSTITFLNPQGAEKEQIILNMYVPLGSKDATKLARYFSDQPLAFFGTLRTEAGKDAIMEGVEQLNYQFNNVKWEGFGKYVTAKAKNATLEQLIRVGEKIAAQDRSANFIAPLKPTPISKISRPPYHEPKSKSNGVSGGKNGRDLKSSEAKFNA